MLLRVYKDYYELNANKLKIQIKWTNFQKKTELTNTESKAEKLEESKLAV